MISGRRWLLAALMTVCVFVGVYAPLAFGQAASAPPAGSATALGFGDGMSLKQMMEVGGGVMYVLALASILTVGFVVYFLYVIRVEHVAPRLLMRDIVDKLKTGGSLDEVRRACEDTPSSLSVIVVTAVDYIKSTPNADPSSLKDMMEGEGARQSDTIQGQAQYLLDIAVLSPMLGLLGTVVGMLQAFNAVALEDAVAKPVALAGGVSKALVATAFGLIVGIPAMGFYGYFRRRASKVVSNLEVASINLFTLLAGRRGK